MPLARRHTRARLRVVNVDLRRRARHRDPPPSGDHASAVIAPFCRSSLRTSVVSSAIFMTFGPVHHVDVRNALVAADHDDLFRRMPRHRRQLAAQQIDVFEECAR